MVQIIFCSVSSTRNIAPTVDAIQGSKGVTIPLPPPSVRGPTSLRGISVPLPPPSLALQGNSNLFIMLVVG